MDLPYLFCRQCSSNSWTGNTEPLRSAHSGPWSSTTSIPYIEHQNPFDGDRLYINFNEEIGRAGVLFTSLLIVLIRLRRGSIDPFHDSLPGCHHSCSIMQVTKACKLISILMEARTPLNAIINYLEIALESHLDKDIREHLTKSYAA